MPRPIGAHATGGIIGLPRQHRQDLGFFRPCEDNFLRCNATRFSGVILTADDSAEPLDCFSKGLDGQFAVLLIGCNGILRSGLDASCTDLAPFSEILNKFIESWMHLKRCFEIVEFPTLCLNDSNGETRFRRTESRNLISS